MMPRRMNAGTSGSRSRRGSIGSIPKSSKSRLVSIAWPLAQGSVTQLLNEAAFAGTPIMVFVSSGGCIQIHSGPVQRIEPMTTPAAEWINVLDEKFNLHLRTDLIAHVWLVEKPTSDGIVTSVEVFDEYGDLMAMFFGARKPGKPELGAWRELATGLPRLDTEAVIA